MPEPIIPPGEQAPPVVPGTGDAPQYVTTADFGKTAALISGLQKTLRTLVEGNLTADKLVELGLLEKGESDGLYKPKAPGTKQEPKPGQQQRPDDDPVILRVKNLEKQLADAKREGEDADKRVAQSELNRAVIGALTKAGAINPDRDFVHLASKVSKGESGYTGKGKDKYDQEIDVGVEDFAEAWLKANPELRAAKSQPGSGTPSGGAGGTGAKAPNGATVITRAQWSDMSWFMTNKAKFDKGEYVRGQD